MWQQYIIQLPLEAAVNPETGQQHKSAAQVSSTGQPHNRTAVGAMHDGPAKASSWKKKAPDYCCQEH
jgi:hypothetical protein